MQTENELRELLEINERRLHELKKQKDSFGLHAPPHISMEITQVETKIKELRQQLGLPGLLPEPVTDSTPPSPHRQTEATSSSQEPAEKKSASKWWIPVAVALISLAGVVFVAVWNNPPANPSEEDMQPDGFAYEVHVVSHVGENLPDAHVIIQVGGWAPLDGFTDSNGFARIFIDGSYAREPARLMVEREGFHPYTQEIDLYPDGLPDRIPLEPIEP